MNPKYSTGYLTPQVNRVKKNVRPRRSESQDNLSVAMDINDSLFERLMDCPIKRQIVLNLIESEKDNIENYKKKQEQKKKGTESPLSKVQKRHVCESPTALLRRRALKGQDCQSPILEIDGASASRSNSRHSSISSGHSPIPFNKLLDGVVAYVEIKSKDEDRSKGAKILMQSMGADVRNQFTKDVTHVIFKDGSFTTYQKAKLMNVHLVSVLWIEAVRSSNTKVSEKRFPALGTEAYNHNVSSICSQMQKDYEEIIRDELRLSLATGTPLPSTKSLINRRRTIMTPAPSSSRPFSQECESSQDKEVEQIIEHGRKINSFCRADASDRPLPKTSPELTDDDSDLCPFINGSIIEHRKDMGRTTPVEEQVVINLVDSFGDYSANPDDSKSSKDSSKAAKDIKTSIVYGISMDLTVIDGPLVIDTSDISTKENDTPNISNNSCIYYKKTPKLRSEVNYDTNVTPKRSEDLFNKPDESLYKRRTRQLRNSINISSDISRNNSNEIKDKDTSRSTMSSLQLSHQDNLQILSKNICFTNIDPLQKQQGDLNRLSLQIPKENCNSNAEKSGSTNMSSLHLSSDSNKNKNNEDISNKIADKSSSTNMSMLLISSDSIKDKTDKSNRIENSNDSVKVDQPLTKVKSSQTFNSNTSNDSFSPLNSNLAKELLHALDEINLPDQNITKRRRKYSANRSSSYTPKRKTGNAPDSDGSRKSNKVVPEETSPQKTISKSGDISVQTSREEGVETDSDGSKRKLCDRRKTIIMKGELDIKKPSSNDLHTGSDSNETSGSDKKGRKLRKLYNPDESVQDVIESDELEREDKRTKVKKQKPHEGVILNPNIVCIRSNILLTSKAKDFVDRNNIDIQTILNRESEESELEKNLTNQAKKKNKEKQVTINSDADEQHELAEEFINRKKSNKSNRRTNDLVRSEGKIVRRRQSIRLSQRLRKKVNLDSSASSTEEKISKRRKPVRLSQRLRKKSNLSSSNSSNDNETIMPITPTFNRRSTMEFQTLSQMSAKKRLKIDKNKQPSIVCTKLHKEEIQVFNQIVKKLGGFIIEDEVSTKTTHLVAGEPKRTINMLRAIAMGCWVLKHEWLLKSLEEGKWLREEDYEQTEFSPAVQQCRLQRQAFGPSYTMDVFQHCEPIYIARGSIPRCSDLKELVSLCKGKVVTIPRNAGIVVGELVRHEDVKCVKETWVLDCITFNKKMPLKKYIIPQNSDSPNV